MIIQSINIISGLYLPPNFLLILWAFTGEINRLFFIMYGYELEYQFLIMESNKQITLAQRDYFRPGTYAGKFKQQLGYAGVANIITTTLLAPLERWRIIAQTQNTYPIRPKKFNNFLNYLSRIPKEQGILAFWRGNSTSLWIYLYQTLFQVGIYDTIKAQNVALVSEYSDTPILVGALNNVVFPLLTSLITLTLIHPLDTYRVQLTMRYHKSLQEAQFNKFRHRLSQVGSFKLFYQGFWLANIISLINFNLYRNLYEAVGKVEVPGVSEEIVNKQLIFSVLAVGLVHPLDTLKKMYQLNNMHKPAIFNGYRDVLKYLRENKLSNSLFSGFTVSITRTALFIPIYWQILKAWRTFQQKGSGATQNA